MRRSSSAISNWEGRYTMQLDAATYAALEIRRTRTSLSRNGRRAGPRRNAEQQRSAVNALRGQVYRCDGWPNNHRLVNNARNRHTAGVLAVRLTTRRTAPAA